MLADFKVGDRVKFIYGKPTNPWYGDEGVITLNERPILYVLFDKGTYMELNGFNMGKGYPSSPSNLEKCLDISNIPEPNDSDLI